MVMDKDLVWRLIAANHPEMKRENFPVDDPYMFMEIVVNNCCRFTAQPGMRVLDIGANIGVFTTLCALAGAVVVAVEPHPGARAQLEETLRRNHIENKVKIFPFAVNSYNGKCNYHPTTTTGTNIEHTWISYNGSINTSEAAIEEQIPCWALSTFIVDQQWDCVKMDIEGAEFDILLNTSAEIFKRIDYLTVELHNGWASLEKYKALIAKLSASFDIDGLYEPDPEFAGETRLVSVFATRVK